jgi:hypothetical protein
MGLKAMASGHLTAASRNKMKSSTFGLQIDRKANSVLGRGK